VKETKSNDRNSFIQNCRNLPAMIVILLMDGWKQARRDRVIINFGGPDE
jgi:hypothetical protein